MTCLKKFPYQSQINILSYFLVALASIFSAVVIQFFWIWNFEPPENNVEIAEGILVRRVCFLITIPCFLAAYKLFNRKNFGIFYTSIAASISSLFAYLLFAHYFTLYYEPFRFIPNNFAKYLVASFFILNLIALILVTSTKLIETLLLRFFIKNISLP